MKVLGLRCSTTDYTFAILSGNRQSPLVEKKATVIYPKGYPKPLALKWFLQDIKALIQKCHISKIVIKASESRVCSKAYEKRIEYEAIVFLAAVNCGIKAVFKKVKSTIAKDMGLKGRARYLSKINTSVIPSFQNYSEKIREAIFAAWSELH